MDNQAQDTAKVLTTPEYLEVLAKEQKITFETVVLGHVSHHQISIVAYDTRDKIEKKMAETMVQVREELTASQNHQKAKATPADIAQLIEEHKLK